MDTMEIYEDCEQFSAFPEAGDVFASDFEKENLLPFGILKVDVDGTSHDVLIAAPIGDDEGRVGKSDLGECCGGLWLTYSKKNGKWSIDCSPEDLLSFDLVRPEALASFEKRKDFFLRNGFLPSRRSEDIPLAMFRVGDAESNSGWNWYKRVKNHIPNRLDDMPGYEQYRQKHVTLIGQDGNEYLWLGSVNARAYSDPLLATDVRVLYSPAPERVLIIFDYS